MNNLTIIGNLTRDPETRTTTAGNVCQFSLAVDRPRKKDTTDFFKVSAWGKTAEVCQNFLRKGSKVCVIGSVSATAYKDKAGEPKASLEVNCNEIEFLSPKQAATEEPAVKRAAQFILVDDAEAPF